MSIEALVSAHVVTTMTIVVLLHQLGVPIPSLPLLIWAGAMTYSEPELTVTAFLLATVAGLAGDTVLFWVGRRYGYRVLRVVCRITISPDSCIRQTELTFSRRGPAMLVTGSLLPGIGSVAPPLAGALGVSIPTYLIYDGAGSALRAASGLALGYLFHDQVAQLNDQLGMLGTRATLLLGLVLAGYLAYRLIQRWLFLRSLRMARVSVDELYDMMSRGDRPLVLDVRSNEHRRLDGRQIPGAYAIDMNDLETTLAQIPRDREVVVYCACPNEASASVVALKLRARGFHRVRPLAGGIDAWVSAGFRIEIVSVAAT